jgi:serine/threonine-protein kinase
LKNAKDVYEISLHIFDELLSDRDPRRASPRIRLGKIAMDEKRFKDAKVYFEEGLKIRQDLLPLGHIQIAQSQQALGGCLLAMGDFSTAIDFLEDALVTFQADSDSNSKEISKVNSQLAKAYLQIGNQEKATYYEQLITARE